MVVNDIPENNSRLGKWVVYNYNKTGSEFKIIAEAG